MISHHATIDCTYHYCGKNQTSCYHNITSTLADHLPLAIKDAVDEGLNGLGSDGSVVRPILQHVISKVNIAVRGTFLHLETKELQDTHVVLFINVDENEQHLKQHTPLVLLSSITV